MDIVAQNKFTQPVIKSDDQAVSVSISGVFVANVVVQRSRSGADNDWQDVETFTAPAERDARSAGGLYWRAGVKTGGFTSGMVTVNVS